MEDYLIINARSSFPIENQREPYSIYSRSTPLIIVSELALHLAQGWSKYFRISSFRSIHLHLYWPSSCPSSRSG